MATAKVVIAGQNNIGPAVKSARNDISAFGQAADKVGASLKKAFAVTAVVAAAKKLGDALSGCLSDFLQAQRVYKQLSVTLKDATAYRSVTENISRLARLTTASKGDVEAMVAELAALGKSAEDVNRISNAAVYLSNVTGRDLTSSMTTLLNTYNGNVTQLRKLGVDTSELTKKELEQGAAVDLVIGKFGKLAEEMASGDTTQHMKNISDNLGDMKQSVGDLANFSLGPLIASFDEATLHMKDSFDAFVQKVKVAIENFPEVWKHLAAALQGGLSKLFSTDGILNFLQNLVKYISSGIEHIGRMLSDLMEMVMGISSSVMDGIGNYAMYWLTSICDRIGVDVSDIINSIGEWLTGSAIGKYVDAVLTTAVNGIRLVQANIRNLPALFRIVVTSIADMLEDLFHGLPTAIGEIFQGIKDIIPGIGLGLRNSILQALEEAINLAGAKIHGSWVGKLLGLGEGLESFSFNLDRTAESEYQTSARQHFALAGNAINIGGNLDEFAEKIEEVLNPTFEKFISDTPASIGAVMAKWTQKSADDYYEAARKNFSNIGDFLDDWGSIFLSDMGDGWKDVSSSFSAIFSDSFGEDMDGFIKWFRPFIEEKLSQKPAAGDGTSIQVTPAAVTDTEDGASPDAGKVSLWGNVLDQFTSKMGEAGSLVGKLSSNMSSMGPVIGAVVTALEYVFDGLAETLGPVLDEFVRFGIDPLRELGRIVGSLLIPLIEKMMPLVQQVASFSVTLFSMFGAVIQPVINIISTALTPVLQILSVVLDAMMPVIKAFAKVVVTVTGTIQYVAQVLQHWVAKIMNWLAGLSIFGWHPFGGLRMSDPGSPGSYTSFIRKQWGAVDRAFDNASSTVSAWSSDSAASTSTSTATALTSASYQGATQVTINIYQQAPVVGDGGMREFARMIRSEFEALSYYGTVTG